VRLIGEHRCNLCYFETQCLLYIASFNCEKFELFFLGSVYVSRVSHTLIGKVCVISGSCGVVLTVRYVAKI